jgi:SAM-dependent methyltransferase
VSQVREFYDNDGWKWVNGQSGDARRWGTTARGPIQGGLDRRRVLLLRHVLGMASGCAAGNGVSMIEFGGGGQPVLPLLDGVRAYTAVDLSGEGLKAAAGAVARLHPEASFVQADVRSLPLKDGQYDVAYSAHMIYHLPSIEDQRLALEEMARVVRPGGVLAIVGANPYPLLFPGRCMRRAIANAPALGSLARTLRRPPPLPYLPMPHSWRSSVLAPFGQTSTYAYGVPPPSFCRRVQESRPLGRLAWRSLAGLETRHPRLALRLGNFTLVVLQKSAT